MDIIVQKYGGSSLAEDEQLRAVAQRIAATRKQGHNVVVVVSAMGATTSRLLAHAGRLNANPEHRELDMLLAAGEQKSASLLSLALQDLGLDAVSLTGAQAGVRTCGAHLNARIRSVDPTRMQRALEHGQIAVVAGFQGASPNGEITTLGRGGSDTTAVAIAAALGAARCEIYSDVDGVYTADPRIVPDAVRLRTVSHDEMKTLAHHGAGVLNERAIDYAIEHDVAIHARKTHGAGSGETIVRSGPVAGRARIAGIACHKQLLRIEFNELSDHAQLRDMLAEFELFAPQLAEGGRGICLLTLEQVVDADGLAAALVERLGENISVTGPLASVSAVGRNAGRDPAALNFARDALAAAGIEARQVFATEHAVSCLVDLEHVTEAMRCFHHSFRIIDTGVADVA